MRECVYKKLFAKYPELKSEYYDVIVNTDDISDALFRCAIPQSWVERLPQHDFPEWHEFGLMPVEYWLVLLEDERFDLIASFFENGRVALICKGRREFNYDDIKGINEGFHWERILIHRPELEEIAGSLNAWESIVSMCPFPPLQLLAHQPQFVDKFEKYDIWRRIDKENYPYIAKSLPWAMKKIKKSKIKNNSI